MQLDCTKRPKPFRRALAALAVAACVLVAQAGLVRHDLGHAFEALARTAAPAADAHPGPATGECPGHPEHGPGEEGQDACPLHGLFAQFSSVVSHGGPVVAAAAAPFVPAIAVAAPARAAARVAFRSRAPPTTPA